MPLAPLLFTTADVETQAAVTWRRRRHTRSFTLRKNATDLLVSTTTELRCCRDVKHKVSHGSMSHSLLFLSEILTRDLFDVCTSSAGGWLNFLSQTMS